MSKNRLEKITSLAIYSFTHLLIDLVSIAVLFRVLAFDNPMPVSSLVLVLTYSFLAFGLQTVVGWVVDRLRIPKEAALIGIVLSALALIVMGFAPILGVVAVAIGNAFFHVGGGVISLKMEPGNASYPGIFVGPGAIGVTLGVLLGKGSASFALPLLVALVCVAALIYQNKVPSFSYRASRHRHRASYVETIIVLLLFSIGVRAFVGSAVFFPWKSDLLLLFVLTGSVAGGKMLGGIVSDKLGWFRVSVTALVLSIPLLLFGRNHALCGILGMLLFQMTMPVTLSAISEMLPGFPGVSFGIACMALLLGALPMYFISSSSMPGLIIVVTIIFSALALGVGLTLYARSIIGRRRML